MLDFDGKVLSGSTGIARWIAEDYGMDRCDLTYFCTDLVRTG